MNLLQQPSQRQQELEEELTALEEVNLVLQEKVSLAQEEAQAQRIRPFLVMTSSMSASKQLLYPLPDGVFTVGPSGDLAPPGAQEVLTLQHVAAQGHVLLHGPGPVRALHHGHQMRTGTCTLQLCLPAAEPSQGPSPGFMQPNGINPEWDDQYFVQELRNKLHLFQHQILAVREMLSGDDATREEKDSDRADFGGTVSDHLGTPTPPTIMVD